MPFFVTTSALGWMPWPLLRFTNTEMNTLNFSRAGLGEGRRAGGGEGAWFAPIRSAVVAVFCDLSICVPCLEDAVIFSTIGR